MPLGQLQAYLMGVLKGEEKEQEIGNLFEKKRKENFPKLVREIDIEGQELQRVLKMKPKRPTPKTHHSQNVKENRNRIIDMKNVLMVAIWGGWVKKLKVLRSINW